MRGLFVTGTGTEVGKTVVSAVLARGLAAAGERVAVFKPAVTGLDDPGETDHALLRRAARSSQIDDEIAPYRYGPPASPHLAAEEAGKEVDPERLRQVAHDAAESADVLVCEGVGGLMVPLAGRATAMREQLARTWFATSPRIWGSRSSSRLRLGWARSTTAC